MPALPDYLGVSDLIMSDTRSGRLKPGDKLPSITELCEQHRTARPPSSRSSSGLEALGVIDRHQGKGIYVTDPATWLRKP